MCDYTPNREAAMTVVERDAGGRPTVWCDPCIEPFVRALNASGLRTVASCCGHGKGPGRISLATGQEFFIVPTLAQANAVYGTLADALVEPGCTPGSRGAGEPS